MSTGTNQERIEQNNQELDDMITIAQDLPDVDEINEKIDAQDEIIENLKSALDDKAGKGGGTPNIFVQTDEPTTKKGIWLKKEAEPDYYIYDEEVYAGGEWVLDTYTTIPHSIAGRAAVSIGTDIYIPTSDSYFYKYDTLTDTYTRLANIPFPFSHRGCTNVGNFIYFFGATQSGYTQLAYKYNINTGTYTQIASLPIYIAYNSATAVGTNIYIFGNGPSMGYYRYAYKYDTLTNTYTRLTDIPYDYECGSAVSIGTDIYIFGGARGKTKAYKYNTLTDTYTQLTNIPYNDNYGIAIAVENNVYIFGGRDEKRTAYKYNTLTDTYTQLPDIPIDFDNGEGAYNGDYIYLFYQTKMQPYVLVGKSYQQDNAVVIRQIRQGTASYEIELYNNSKEVTSPKYLFNNAWYYTIQDGLETDIPTYYGDGTQWVNIKNPPQEEV